MDVQDSFDLRVEQISIAVGVQLQLTIQPGLQNVDGLCAANIYTYYY